MRAEWVSSLYLFSDSPAPFAPKTIRPEQPNLRPFGAKLLLFQRISWPLATSLRDVIAERRKHHILHGLGRNSARAGPAALRQVRILHPPADAALRPLIRLEPEARASLGDDADVARASAACSRRERSGRCCFCRAAAVVRGR